MKPGLASRTEGPDDGRQTTDSDRGTGEGKGLTPKKRGDVQSVYFGLCWAFAAMWAFSSCYEWGLLSSCSAPASPCGGFSGCGTQAPGHVGSSSCGPQTQLPLGLGDLPRLGVEPVSPALTGGFLATGPPGTSQ